MPWHSGCPGTCDDTCDCQPCPDCARGKNCDHCDGSHAGTGCTSCKLGRRAETAGERAAREARQEAALAAHRARHPLWPGPRRFRTDIPHGAALAAVSGGDEDGEGGGGFRFGRRPPPPIALGPGASAGNIWVTHCLSRRLGGAASHTREALQLLDAVALEAGIVSPRSASVLSSSQPAVAAVGERMYLVQAGAGGHTQAYRGSALCLPEEGDGEAALRAGPKDMLHTDFDVPLAQAARPSSGAWAFTSANKHVVFPYGPVTLAGSLAAPSPLSHAVTLTFQYAGGNHAWACGAFPASLAARPASAAAKCFLWDGEPSMVYPREGSMASALPSLSASDISACRAGFKHGGGSEHALPGFPTPITTASVISMTLCGRAHTLAITVNGVLQGEVFHLPPAAFPMRLGICGHSGSSFTLASPPPAAPVRVYAAGDRVRLWRPPTTPAAGWGGGGCWGMGSWGGRWWQRRARSSCWLLRHPTHWCAPWRRA